MSLGLIKVSRKLSEACYNTSPAAHLAITGLGHSHVQAVQNVMHAAALHLDLNALGKQPLARLTRSGKSTKIDESLK